MDRNILSVLISCLSLISTTAYSAEYFWINPAGGEFSDSTHWQSGLVPTTLSDTAIFDLSSAGYTVAVTSPVTIQNTIIRNDEVTFDLNANTYTLTTINNGLIVGENTGNYARFTLVDGVLQSNFSKIGLSAGATGNVTIQGNNTSWLAHEISIGAAGNGTLQIQNDATVTNSGNTLVGNIAGSTGKLSVSGPGSQFNGTQLHLGINGNASMDITSAATVNTDTAYIGLATGGKGTVTIDAAGSYWTSSNIWIGSERTTANANASGELIITNGAVVDTGQLIIADGAGSSGLINVNGINSNLNAHNIEIGSVGTGHVNVQAGASVTGAFDIQLGKNINSTGVANITGVGSLVNADNIIHVGVEGLGELSVNNGATVQAGSIIVGEYATSKGSLLVSGAGTTLDANISTGVSTSVIDVFISDGARVNSANTVFNSGTAPSFADIRIEGTGTKWNSDIMQIGGLTGNANVSVSTGGAINNTGMIRMGTQAGTSGVLSVNDSGSVVATKNLQIGTNGKADATVNNGELLVDNNIELGTQGMLTIAGGVISASQVNSFDVQNGTINFTGGEMNVDIFWGDLDNHGGTVDPGKINTTGFAGTTLISGDYTQDIDSALSIEIGGTVAEFEYQYLWIGGIASLDGLLTVDLVDSYNPFAGDYFDILFANQIIGDFNQLLLPQLSQGLDWEVMFLDGAIAGGQDTYRLNIISSVPVPAAIWLFGTGLLMLVSLGHKKKMTL